MNSRLYQTAEDQPKWHRTTWGAVLGWAGVYLGRLLIGCTAGIVLIVCGYFLADWIHPEIKVLGDAPIWFFIIVSLLPVLGIASVVFVPLFTDIVSGEFSGEIKAIAATRFLIIPAIVLQVFAAPGDGFWLGVTNFVVVVGVCFLVTLALDDYQNFQFLLLVTAGAQGIVLCTGGFLAFSLFRIDLWQVEAVPWLGAIPPLILLGWLFFRCHRKLQGEAAGYSRRQQGSHDSSQGNYDVASQESLPTDLKVGEETLSRVSSTSKTERSDKDGNMFFYVGADNEPIGPISSKVLLQLRRSGSVTDETFIAREGEGDWEALGDRLDALEASTTS